MCETLLTNKWLILGLLFRPATASVHIVDERHLCTRFLPNVEKGGNENTSQLEEAFALLYSCLSLFDDAECHLFD